MVTIDREVRARARRHLEEADQKRDAHRDRVHGPVAGADPASPAARSKTTITTPPRKERSRQKRPEQMLSIQWWSQEAGTAAGGTRRGARAGAFLRERRSANSAEHLEDARAVEPEHGEQRPAWITISNAFMTPPTSPWHARPG